MPWNAASNPTHIQSEPVFQLLYAHFLSIGLPDVNRAKNIEQPRAFALAGRYFYIVVPSIHGQLELVFRLLKQHVFLTIVVCVD